MTCSCGPGDMRSEQQYETGSHSFTSINHWGCLFLCCSQWTRIYEQIYTSGSWKRKSLVTAGKICSEILVHWRSLHQVKDYWVASPSLEIINTKERDSRHLSNDGTLQACSTKDKDGRAGRVPFLLKVNTAKEYTSCMTANPLYARTEGVDRGPVPRCLISRQQSTPVSSA